MAGPALVFILGLPAGTTVLIEGDRLYNGSFIRRLKEAGINPTLIELQAEDAVLAARHRARADDQDETWLRSRQTKLDNIRSTYKVKVRKNNNLPDREANVAYLRRLITKPKESE